jgi:hypothetical protein
MPEEEKEEDMLKELCAGDAKLLDALGRMLYLDPIAAISPKSLDLLREEAETSVKDGNYEDAIRKYRVAVDKALLEATQTPEERSKYIKVIQDLAAKTIHATKKAKETADKQGLAPHAASLETNIEHYKFVSQKIEDIVNVATHFYNEKLATLGDAGRREARREKIRALETEAGREARGEAERREARREARKEMGRAERREADKEEKKIRAREEERHEARREEIRGMEEKERQEAWGDKERRQARRKKRREARRKELE